jgi:predicted RNA-binding protein with PUA-like domain
MNHWLFKSEPFKFSLDDLKTKGEKGEEWDGVRNYAARNNMRAMQIGDLGFFYHSNEGLNVVGIVEVCALAHPDSTADDPRWECVDILPTSRPIRSFRKWRWCVSAASPSSRSHARNGKRFAAWAASYLPHEADGADGGDLHPRQYGAASAAACAGNCPASRA